MREEREGEEIIDCLGYARMGGYGRRLVTGITVESQHNIRACRISDIREYQIGKIIRLLIGVASLLGKKYLSVLCFSAK